MVQSLNDKGAPSAVRTLQMHADAGELPRLPLVTLRAQLATADTPSLAEIRRAATALLVRIEEYWRAIDYCGGATQIGTSELPCAMPAPQFAERYGNFYTGMRITDPSDGPEKIWNQAHAICLNTALHLAQWEIGKALPDSTELLRLGRLAALSACKSESITGLPWGIKSSRRITTAGIRKRVAKALTTLPNAYLLLHPDSGAPSFHIPDDFARIAPMLESRALENNQALQVCPPRPAAMRDAA